MRAVSEQSIHEVDFCGQIASAANVLFAQDPTAFSFAEARVEGFGKGAGRRKRKDLRFFEPGGKLALCGEVKLPGTREGQSPFGDAILEDAFRKAENAGVRFFFTWNVKEFVLFDRSQWDKPLLERRVQCWRLNLNLASAEDVAQHENLQFIKTRFLPDLLRDLGDIYAGRRRDWTMAPDDPRIRESEDATTTVWVRVFYRPRGIESTTWAYGWVFASDSMSRAWDTMRRVGDWRKWEYRLEKLDPRDVDYPDNRDRFRSTAASSPPFDSRRQHSHRTENHSGRPTEEPLD